MPAIRNKFLQSRRVGSALNGMGFFDQTDWTGDYEYDPYDTGDYVYTESPAAQQPSDSNILQQLFTFGSKLLQPKPQQTFVPVVQQQAQTSVRNNTSLLLLAAAGLAAIYIVSRK